MAVNLSVLFTKLGLGFFAQQTINTARGTTIPTQTGDYIADFATSSTTLLGALAQANSAYDSGKTGLSAAISNLSQSLQTVLIETVHADHPLPSKTLQNALIELIRQMQASGDDVDAGTVASTASAVTGNGDGILVASHKRGDGKPAENLLAEAITLECTSDSSPRTATFNAKGAAKQSDRLREDWPLGSGDLPSLSVADPSSSTMLTNGDFELETERDNSPDGWVLSVGTAGTHVKLTNPAILSIVVSGSPSAGTYTVSVTHPFLAKVQTTDPLAYNATGSSLQAALRELKGFESVTVATSGTSPNYTHLITCTGVAGATAAPTVTNNTTGGTFTPTVGTAGDTYAYRGKSLQIVGSATLAALQQRITPVAFGQYAFSIRAVVDVIPAAGVVTVDLVDGIGGSVIADAEGVNNTFTISVPGLTTAWSTATGVFRLPKVVPALVFLRIRATTAITAGSILSLDEAALEPMAEMYPGGPWAKFFAGRADFFKGDDQHRPDYFTLTQTNDRAGLIQEWFERNFDMSAKGLLLPSDAGGTETISDGLVA